MFNDSLLRSATENRWDRHFILINVPNGFAHKTRLFLHWCMFGLSLSPSYFQVDNAYANPSRLTTIIRIIRGAVIWYEPSWVELSGTSEPPWHQNNPVESERSAPEIKFYFHLQMQFIFIYIFIFYFNNQRRQALFEFSALLSQQRQPHSWGLHNSVSINNLYLLKRYQPSAEGIINIICCARSRCLLHRVCLCEWRFSGVNVCFPRKSAGLRIKSRPAAASAYLNSLSFGKFYFCTILKIHLVSKEAPPRRTMSRKSLVIFWWSLHLFINKAVSLKRIYTYVEPCNYVKVQTDVSKRLNYALIRLF